MDYYNEIDPYCAEWLGNLMDAGLIGRGEIDTRSIEDVTPNDVRGYTQCHFFAGIGVWSYALRQAGWPVDRPAWTGSCPCQPFSAAGKGGGFADERHLWPAWHWLIGRSRPNIIFGEQVASKDGLAWLDLVSADLEAEGYTFGALDLCSAGFGAPNIRQRLFLVGVENSYMSVAEQLARSRARSEETSRSGPRRQPDGRGSLAGTLAHARCEQRERGSGVQRSVLSRAAIRGEESVHHQRRGGPMQAGNTYPTNGFWRDVDWLLGRDGKWRPVEPGASPLASGVAGKVGRLRAYGNAINAEVAIGFVEAVLDAEHDGFVECD